MGVVHPLPDAAASRDQASMKRASIYLAENIKEALAVLFNKQ